MNQEIKRDIITIIDDAVKIIKDKNPYGLRELSNHTIHNASIFQDEFSITIAVVVYSLSKVISTNAGSAKRFAELLVRARNAMEKEDLKSYRSIMASIVGIISKLDSRFRGYMDDVMSQAQIRKGSKIYDHGISLGQAASVLGISQWELMQYLGATKGTDSPYDKSNVVDKLKYARGLFG